MSTTNLPPLIPLREVVQTPDYSKKVMDIIDRIHRAPDVPGVLEMLRISTLTIGARASMYADAIPEDDSNLTLKVLLACDPLWGYAQQCACPLELHPWFAYASKNFRPIAASRIAAEAVQQREAVAIAHQHGFSSAFIVPTPTGGGLGGFGVLCLASELQGEFDHEDTHVVRVLARTLAMELHEWFANETRDWLLHSAGLRPGDLQLLALERRGLGTKAIARAMGLSAVSVHSRFQRINARLACSRRKDAARRAAEYGLI